MQSVVGSKHVGEIRALITNQGSWALFLAVNTEHLVFCHQDWELIWALYAGG